MADGYSTKSPWRFVPVLYFLQGIPVVLVQTVSVTLYKNLDVPNDQIGLWTSLIGWPWIAKMLWGPLVEGTGTRRSWVVWSQALLIAALGAVALGVPQPAFLAITLGLFFLVAFLSATHDIAADGFYLLALPPKDQAFFVGIRSTAFRLAMIFGTGFLVAYAGKLHDAGQDYASVWVTVLLIASGVYALGVIYNARALPKPPLDERRASPAVAELLARFLQVLFLLVGVFLLGRLVVLGAGWLNQVSGAPMVVAPPEHLTPLFLPATAGQGADVKPFPFLAATPVLPWGVQLAGSLALLAVVFASTRSLFAKIQMGPVAKSYFSQPKIAAILAFVLFYRFGEVMIGKMSSPFLLDPVEKGGLAVGNQAAGVLSGTIGVLGLLMGGIAGGALIARFGIKKCLWPMVLALNVPNLLYVWLAYTRPASPLATKIAEDTLPFAHVDVGGWGLGQALLPVADFVVNLPSQAYNGLLLLKEAVMDPIGQVVLADQFGYGFGFSAYMVYLMFISQTTKHQQTSHYALSTGLMALGATVSGVVSGYLQVFFADRYGQLGYAYFFIAVLVCTVPGMITLFFIPMKGEDVKQAVAND